MVVVSDPHPVMHPDASILADCHAWIQLHGRHDEVYRGWGDLPNCHPDQIAADARVDAYEHAKSEIVGRLGEVSPLTPEGRQARGKVLLASIGSDGLARLHEVIGDRNAGVLEAVLREMAREAAA